MMLPNAWVLCISYASGRYVSGETLYILTKYLKYLNIQYKEKQRQLTACSLHI
jgi:hypothetical protein